MRGREWEFIILMDICSWWCASCSTITRFRWICSGTLYNCDTRRSTHLTQQHHPNWQYLPFRNLCIFITYLLALCLSAKLLNYNLMILLKGTVINFILKMKQTRERQKRTNARNFSFSRGVVLWRIILAAHKIIIELVDARPALSWHWRRYDWHFSERNDIAVNLFHLPKGGHQHVGVEGKRWWFLLGVRCQMLMFELTLMEFNVSCWMLNVDAYTYVNALVTN